MTIVKEGLEVPLIRPIRWCGFDFAYTLIDPRDSYRVVAEAVPEIFVELKRPEVIDKKVSLTLQLAKKCGEADQASRYGLDWFLDGTRGGERTFWEELFPLRQLIQRGMVEFYRVVLDNDPRAIELFREKRKRSLKPAKGLMQCLRHLEEEGVSINIVSDASAEGALQVLFEFLNFYDLKHFFSDIITPVGCFKEDGTIDLSYKGLEKIDGGMYEKLVKDLRNAGISPSEAMVVGDRPVDDVTPAKEKGLKTVQFVGVIDRGPSDADYVISDLAQLRDIV